MNGFVLLHRKIVDWEWYTDVNTKCLFLHLILMANHKDEKWRGNVIKRGTFVTSIANLSVQTGLTFQQVRTSLKKLQKTGDITIKSTNKNTLIMVVKYEFYQSEQQTVIERNNKRVTNNQQSNNKQVTTNNNDNNDNNDNKYKKESIKEKRFSKPTLKEVASYCRERKNNIDPQRFIDFYEAKGWMVGRNKMKDWKACVRTWERKDKDSGFPDWYTNTQQQPNDPELEDELEDMMKGMGISGT